MLCSRVSNQVIADFSIIMSVCCEFGGGWRSEDVSF